MAEDASQVRKQIAQERAELATTVKGLAEKADVKARVRRKASDSAGQIQHKAGAVADQIHQTADDAGDRLRSATPDPLVSGMQTASTTVRRKPVPVAGAVMLVIVAVLVSRRRRRSR